MKQLTALQNFQEAYLAFFGLGSWGRFTFFNPLGPISIADQPVDAEPAALDTFYEVSRLNDRLNKVMTTAQPSLQNNESEGPDSPYRDYFDQIKDSLVRVSKIHGQLARIHPQLHFVKLEVAKARTEVDRAQNGVSSITAVLPSVKLPTSNGWMSQRQKAGSDGTIEVTIKETGPGVSVQQSWTGGDGSMAGTVILTAIRYDDIGNIVLEPPSPIDDSGWTVRIESAHAPFPQKIDSPERKTARGTFPPVNYTTAESGAYFAFRNSAEAQDAYAYFLYHKQVGR
jgi:hypothetical protein